MEQTISQDDMERLERVLAKAEKDKARSELRRQLERQMSGLSDHKLTVEYSNILDLFAYLERNGMLDLETSDSFILKDATPVYIANAVDRSLRKSFDPFRALKKNRRFHSYGVLASVERAE